MIDTLSAYFSANLIILVGNEEHEKCSLFTSYRFSFREFQFKNK